MVETKSTTGLPKTTVAALSAMLGPTVFGSVVFLMLEKNPYVRFYSIQSIVVFVGLYIVHTLMVLTVILAVLVPLVWILGFVLWLLLIFKALQGIEWELPVAGKFSRKLLGK